MKISVIKIGNSKGIRFSKTLLEKYQIEDQVELVMESDHILIKPVSKPRENWDKSFQEMHKNCDDQLLINDFFEDENWDEAV